MELNYFFAHINELSFKDLFDDCCDIVEVFQKLNSYLEEKTKKIQENHSECSEFVSLNGNYYIGHNTKIGASTTIIGPVIIGNNVNIMPGALIRPYTIIGDNCEVGHGSEIKRAIVMDKAKVASHTFVGDSVIGYKARIGSGTILANRRFDQGIVVLKKDGEVISLQSDFFGSVIGDQSRLGANTTSYPGTFIGKNTWIYPGTCIKGFIPSLKRVSNKSELCITDNKEYDLN